MDDLRLALVQLESKVGDTRGNLWRIGEFAREAAGKGASIVCFPELSVTGYGQSVSMRSHAEPVPGPATAALVGLARQQNITIVAGLLESGPAGSVLNTQLTVDGTGVLGRYAKTHVPAIERPAFDPGIDVSVVEHPRARVGVQICYDIHFPELSALMCDAGAEVLLVPHASGGEESRSDKLDRWMRYLPARACDNAVYVAVCNATGRTAEGAPLYGIAAVIDPFGRMVAITETSSETVLTVDLSAQVLAAARSDPNGFLRTYRRPDLYGGPAARS